MAAVYFDSSALVKLLMSEAESDVASEVWDGCDAPVASRLAYPEVCAALAAAQRNGLITISECEEAAAAWEMFWGAVRQIELSAEVARSAGRLARDLGLRSADAVHLASALELGMEDLVIAVWDRQLHSAALAAGLRVVPAALTH